ncbi:LysR substrate-binding domain-containing protein [Sorangium sp. So ce429]
MEAGADRFLHDASGHEKEAEGLFRLALTESIAVHGVIPRVLPALAEKHPRVSLHLLTSYEVADLGHREAEIAVRIFRPKSGDLVAARIVTLPTVPIAHRKLSKKSAVSRIVLARRAGGGNLTLPAISGGSGGAAAGRTAAAASASSAGGGSESAGSRRSRSPAR